eukprot:1030355-Alexandrium_andersonii.AAC.1
MTCLALVRACAAVLRCMMAGSFSRVHDAVAAGVGVGLHFGGTPHSMHCACHPTRADGCLPLVGWQPGRPCR